MPNSTVATSPPTTEAATTTSTTAPAVVGTPDVTGTWYPDSSTFVYDAGGSGSYDGGTNNLVLGSDGSWHYGSSSGSYKVRPITSGDWATWRVSAYGPTWALELDGWNGRGTSTGPIETTGSTVDDVWIIYHVQSPDPGLVDIKLGHE